MFSVTYAECRKLTNKPIMLDVIMMSVVMLSVMAPHHSIIV